MGETGRYSINQPSIANHIQRTHSSQTASSKRMVPLDNSPYQRVHNANDALQPIEQGNSLASSKPNSPKKVRNLCDQSRKHLLILN